MKFTIYEPGRSFPAVSVTGAACGMECAHCSGKYLSGMAPVETPDKLWEFARLLADRGGTGLLISGGCDSEGGVPLAPFLPTVGRIKRELPLKINIHVGLCGGADAKKLAAVKPDVVSVDIIGSDETVREVFGLKKGAEDYWKSYQALTDAGLNVVPHITIGLRGGEDSGELAALERLRLITPGRLVLNILIPTKGTAFEGRTVDRRRALEVLKAARSALPDTCIILGCMRPRGWTDFEIAAVEHGISGIVNPSRDTVDRLRTLGRWVERRAICCAVG